MPKGQIPGNCQNAHENIAEHDKIQIETSARENVCVRARAYSLAVVFVELWFVVRGFPHFHIAPCACAPFGNIASSTEESETRDATKKRESLFDVETKYMALQILCGKSVWRVFPKHVINMDAVI